MTLKEKIQNLHEVRNKAIDIADSTFLPKVKYNHFIYLIDSMIKIIEEIENDA